MNAAARPTISVLMGMYDCAELLPAAIDSLLAQTFDDWELVACDDGSRDATWEVASDYARRHAGRITLLRNAENSGLAYTLNRCLEAARGPFLARQDADDTSTPDRFATQLRFLREHPDYGWVSTAMTVFDGARDVGVRVQKAAPDRGDLIRRSSFAHATTMFRAEVLRAVGGYRVTSYTRRRQQDYDLWMRLFGAGYRGYNLPEPLYRVREDQGAYARKRFRHRVDEAILRAHGYGAMKAPPWAYVHVLRPLAIGLLPPRMLRLIHEARTRSAPASPAAAPPRILHVVSNMDRGGAETMLMNYYRKLDRSLVQFDFLVHAARPGQYDAEIEGLGGRILRIESPGSGSVLSYVRSARQAMRSNGPYRAVHVHTNAPGALACVAARLAGIEHRIAHSHNTAPRRMTTRFTVPLEEAVLKLLIRATANRYCSCGRAAAKYLFGERLAETPERVVMLPNAIDVTSFERVWAEPREASRASLGLSPGEVAIGQVASLIPVKNHAFTLRVAQHLHEAGVAFRVFIIGDGQLRRELGEQVRATGLAEHVRFLGVRSDVPRLLRALDVFLLPSLFEGLPLSMIEAQAAALPCVVSDAVTAEADLGLGLVRRIGLAAGERAWAESIRAVAERERPVAFEDVRQVLRQRGFDSAANVHRLYDLYGVDAPAAARAAC